MKARARKAGVVTMPATTFAQLLAAEFDRGRASVAQQVEDEREAAYLTSVRAEVGALMAAESGDESEPTYSQGVLDGMQLTCQHNATHMSIDERLSAYLAGRQDREDER